MGLKTIDREICPHCGQTMNYREISLFSGMVRTLIAVYVWCLQNNVHEFSRKDIHNILLKRGESNVAHWGDWILFGGGMVYKPKGRGTWGLNLKRVNDFIQGKLEIPIRVKKRQSEVIVLKTGSIHDVKDLSAFLDEHHDFLVKYLQ